MRQRITLKHGKIHYGRSRTEQIQLRMLLRTKMRIYGQLRVNRLTRNPLTFAYLTFIAVGHGYRVQRRIYSYSFGLLFASLFDKETQVITISC